MELYEMLSELWEMVETGDIYYDDCEHENVARPEARGEDGFCPVCFITNLYQNCSDSDPAFTEETTEQQRETIQGLWDQWCDA
jgi:hypothetical protein